MELKEKSRDDLIKLIESLCNTLNTVYSELSYEWDDVWRQHRLIREEIVKVLKEGGINIENK